MFENITNVLPTPISHSVESDMKSSVSKVTSPDPTGTSDTSKPTLTQSNSNCLIQR